MDYAAIASQVNAEFKVKTVDCNLVHSVFTGEGYTASHPVLNRIKVLLDEQATKKPKKKKRKCGNRANAKSTTSR